MNLFIKFKKEIYDFIIVSVFALITYSLWWFSSIQLKFDLIQLLPILLIFYLCLLVLIAILITIIGKIFYDIFNK